MSESGDRDDGPIAALATALCSLVLAACYFAVAPGAGHATRQPGLLASYSPGGWYPDLTRPRETLLGILVTAAPPLVAFAVWSLRRAFARRAVPLRRASIVAQAAIAAILITAAYGGNNVQPDIAQDYFGWNVRTAILSATIALFLTGSWIVARRYARLFRATRTSIAVVAAVLGLSYMALALYQAPNSVRDRTDVALTFDDLLAPANGTHALGSTIPRYSSLYGEVLAPVVQAGVDPVVAAFALVDSLTVALFVSLFVAFRLSGVGAKNAGLAIVFCFFCTIRALPFAGAAGGHPLLFYLNAFDYPQLLPVRYFAPIVTGAMTIGLCRKPDQALAFALGATLPLFIVNDPTFGLASAAIAIATLVVDRLQRGAGTPARAVAGSLLTTGMLGAAAGIGAILALSLLLTGSLPNVASLTAPGRLYAGGAAMYPIAPAWNAQIVPFVIFLFTLAYGIARRARAAFLYFGSLGCVSYLYYLDRPVPSTLLEATFFLSGICLVLVLADACRPQRPLRSVPIVSWTFATIAVTLAFGASAIWTLPNEAVRDRLGFDRPRSLTMDTNARAADAAPIEAFVARHHAGAQMILDHVNGRILALRLHTHDVTPLVPNVFFAEEARRFVDVAIERKSPPIFATPDAAPEIIAAIERLGYAKVDAIPQIGLYVRRTHEPGR